MKGTPDCISLCKVHVVVTVQFVSTEKSARPFDGPSLPLFLALSPSLLPLSLSLLPPPFLCVCVCVFGTDFGLRLLRVELFSRDSAEQKTDKVRRVGWSCFSPKDLVTKENSASHVASIRAKFKTNKWQARARSCLVNQLSRMCSRRVR